MSKINLGQQSIKIAVENEKQPLRRISSVSAVQGEHPEGVDSLPSSVWISQPLSASVLAFRDSKCPPRPVRLNNTPAVKEPAKNIELPVTAVAEVLPQKKNEPQLKTIGKEPIPTQVKKTSPTERLTNRSKSEETHDKVPKQNPHAPVLSTAKPTATKKAEIIDHTYQIEKAVALVTDKGKSCGWIVNPATDTEHANIPQINSLQALPPPPKLITQDSWPSSYLGWSLLSMLIMPLLGVIAIYSSLLTRAALRDGEYILAVERSQNTKVVLAYTITIGVLTWTTVLMTLGAAWINFEFLR